MGFSVRLNALMNLMEVANSKMARHLRVDPSLVSRWRNGSRKPTKDQKTIQKISSYLVSQIATKYHLSELAKMLNNPEVNDMKEKEIAEQIFLWLKAIDTSDAIFPPPDNSRKLTDPEITDAYAGVVGRSMVLKKIFENFNPNRRNIPVYFYSNDPVEIFHQDIAVSLEALNENPRLFDNIGDIHLIINDNSTAQEVEAYLSFLLPFLLNGRLSVVQTPHYRKESFNNSILIVGDQLAAASHGFAEGDAIMANLYSKTSFVTQLTEDFRRIFDRGTPLHTTNWDIDFFEIVDDNLKLWIIDKPVTYIGNALPICSANTDIITLLTKRAGLIEGEKESLKITAIVDYFIRYEQFLEREQNVILMPLFSLEDVRAGAAKVACLPRFTKETPLITEEEYLIILKTFATRLNVYENLVLKIIPKIKHEYVLRIQKDNYCAVVRNTEPYVNYTSVAPAFIHGFASLLDSKYGNKKELTAQREKNIELLQKHIVNFEQQLDQGV